MHAAMCIGCRKGVHAHELLRLNTTAMQPRVYDSLHPASQAKALLSQCAAVCTLDTCSSKMPDATGPALHHPVRGIGLCSAGGTSCSLEQAHRQQHRASRQAVLRSQQWRWGCKEGQRFRPCLHLGCV
jgi:hypothetical protein